MTGANANGWNPIETRPQGEGVRVMYFYPRVGRKIEEQEFISIGGGYISNYQWRQPSHWMPLPEPPAALESKEGR